MYKIIEVYFDLFYLLLVMGFSIRLLLERGKRPRVLAIMSFLLVIGDAFHLLPRIYGHLSAGGLEANRVYLSYGMMVTSFTMTIFYMIFYYYYKLSGGKTNRFRNLTLFLFFILRIIFLLLPANNWGGVSPYYMSILRNVPFLIMGILLITWIYKDKNLSYMKNISYLIAGSFFFYSLVIVFSEALPIFGAFMLPKTVCYILIVYHLYKIEVPEFENQELFKSAISALILSMILGVFYREFTKLFSYQAFTSLSLVHGHTLILGFLFSFILYILYRIEDLNIEKIKKIYGIYIISLVYFISSFIVRGIYQITASSVKIYSEELLAGFAGIGHIILAVSLISILIKSCNNLQKNVAK